jgi:hypothetical protein
MSSTLDRLPNNFVDITIDERSFAKKPWDFEFVNSYCEYLPLDQCGFRKRRLAVYPLLAVWTPIRELICILLSAVMLFLGLRKINWKVFNPFGRTPFNYLGCDTSFSNSIFIQNKKGEFEFWRTAFYPPVLSIVALIDVLQGHWVLIGLLIWIPLFLFVACVIKLARMVYDWMFPIKSEIDCNKLIAEIQKQKAIRDAEEAKLREQALLDKLNVLNCKLVPDKIGLDTLPQGKQTIRLRFLDLKRKVCRPFAR